MDEEAYHTMRTPGTRGERGRPWLLAAGAITIVVLLLIAAFSLGVYVGEHGWTREGLTLHGPGGQPGLAPPLQDGPGAPPPLPGGGRPPDLVGGVRRVLQGTLLLATPDGPRTVEVDGGTEVETRQGDARSLDDLRPGQSVAVYGYRSGDGQTLVAELIVLLPAPEKPRAEP
jgi:hypothetical protein